MRLLIVLALLGASGAQAVTQTGQINGAQFRIDLPEKWNHAGLVVYCHGYSPVAGTYENPGPNDLVKFFTSQGFAAAQSGYAAGGWAIREAVEDTAATIVFFTYILKDLQQRGGGNPFDNRSVLYQGSPDDNALNDGVKRYAADPREVTDG